LPIKEIWPVDIEEGRKKLKIVCAMAKRMVKAAGMYLLLLRYTDMKKPELLYEEHVKHLIYCGY